MLPVWLTLTIQTLVGQNLLILYPDIEQGGSEELAVRLRQIRASVQKASPEIAPPDPGIT